MIKLWAWSAKADNFRINVDEMVDFGGTGNYILSQKMAKLLTLTAPEVKFSVKKMMQVLTLTAPVVKL